MKKLDEIKANLEKLKLFVPVVDRVHGESHPEFHDVRKIFNEIIVKINVDSLEKAKLDNEFKQLRKITNNYTIPSDVCESYEAVYNMLAELDETYKG